MVAVWLTREILLINRLVLGALILTCVCPAAADNSRFVVDMDAQVNASQYDDFTVVVGDKSGVLYKKSKGNYDFDRHEIIASASKLVSAVVLMDLVESNILSLDSSPHEFIDEWENADSETENISLRQLLSLTSGLVGHKCTNRSSARFERCAKRIFEKSLKAHPGTIYDYHSSHMQIAGLMAIRALGLSNWNEVFDRFKEKYSLFSEKDVYTSLRRRSQRNPLLAAGLRTTPRNYAAFLSKLLAGKILGTESIQAVFSNHTNGLVFEKSPIQSGLGEHWDYGLGVWIEYHKCDGDAPNCDQPVRYSSPGAFGFYPWISGDMTYFALVARKGRIFGRGDRSDIAGIKNGREFQPILQKHLIGERDY